MTKHDPFIMLPYDIYVDAGITEVAKRRSEFAAILKTGRIDRLPTLLCPRRRHQL
jgi:hypothetical protein